MKRPSKFSSYLLHMLKPFISLYEKSCQLEVRVPKRHVMLSSLLLLGITGFMLSLLLEYTNTLIPISLFPSIPLILIRELVNISPNLITAYIVIISIDYLLEEKIDKIESKLLIFQLRNLDPLVAAAALRKIRSNKKRVFSSDEIDLQRIKLTGLELSEIDLYRANLDSADFSRSNMTNSNLSQIHARRSDFSFANLRHSNIRSAYLHSANFSQAILDSTDFCHSTLAYANLKMASANNTNFEETDLTGANLEETDLTGANLEGANLRGANLRGAKVKSANIKNVVFDEKTMWPYDFVHPKNLKE